jgi:hypothetical protein
MMLLLRRIAAMVTSAGVLSCGDAAVADSQDLTLPGVGVLRLKHSHRMTTADTPKAQATAQSLIDWTRTNQWDRLRVVVDEKHPLVIKLKAGGHLSLTPEDVTLPIIWLSLDGESRVLLETRAHGRLSIFAMPPGKMLDLSWLGP